MKCRPFENHRRRTIGKRALENRDRLDSDSSFIPGINGMDVWRTVVVEIHTNHDAEEAADLGHLPISYHVLFFHSPGRGLPLPRRRPRPRSRHFRAEALRAVYVEWKAGGQANYLKEFGGEWWSRWQQTMARGFSPADMAKYEALGIGYIVLPGKNRLPQTPAFENAKYVAYAVQ
jgi:hypothetical protein